MPDTVGTCCTPLGSAIELTVAVELAQIGVQPTPGPSRACEPSVGCFPFLRMIAIDTAIERWKREDIVLRPPLEQSVVAAKFITLGRRCSRDVLALYAATGGMEDGECDSHMWSLWKLDRVVSETDAYGRPYILFADFLINSHFYCFKYKNEEQSSVVIDYTNGRSLS